MAWTRRDGADGQLRSFDGSGRHSSARPVAQALIENVYGENKNLKLPLFQSSEYQLSFKLGVSSGSGQMGVQVELPAEQSLRVEFRSPQGELLDLALERVRYEYTELAETWKLLDIKAQATAAIAGVFLAALFALKAWEASDGAKFASIGLVFLLITSIGCCLWAMRVTSFQMPPSGNDTFNRVKAYLNLALRHAADAQRQTGHDSLVC